jgi:hypothetical protein
MMAQTIAESGGGFPQITGPDKIDKKDGIR